MKQRTYKLLLSSLLGMGLCLSGCSSNPQTAPDPSPDQSDTTEQASPEVPDQADPVISAETSGKVLQLTPELVILSDETGELQRFSGELEGISLGGRVNLTYNPEENSLISGEQIAQEADLLGAFETAFLLLDGDLPYYEAEFQLFFQFDQLTFLSDPEKEILLARLTAQAPDHVISSLSTWEDLEEAGLIQAGTTEPLYSPDQVIGGKYYAFFSEEPTENSFTLRISNDGTPSTQEIQVTLDPETGIYTGALVGMMAG